MAIDDIPTHAPPTTTQPDVSRPRLGPGAPPIPPARGREEAWAAYGARLRAYRRAVKAWPLTRGWSEHDRQNFLTQADGYLDWVGQQKDVTP